jgi:TRAP-type mannitol/chloroaromatic compound transport system permease small subunit
LRALRKLLEGTLRALSWLVIPLSFLLFLQWPLREVVHGYSREANDLGQCLFAIYVAASVTAATLGGTHLAADALARHYPERVRMLLLRFGQLLALAPWAIFVALSARSPVLLSVRSLEGFPDTANPGYFIVKAALWLLAAAILLAIVVDTFGGRAGDDSR